jgi:hypothetical protein
LKESHNWRRREEKRTLEEAKMDVIQAGTKSFQSKLTIEWATDQKL